MKKYFSLLLFFSLTGNIVAEKYTNPLVFSNHRITIIADGLLRLEYAVDGKFHDDQTMFAFNRNELYRNFEVEKIGNDLYKITTPRMTIIYKADNYPFGAFNLNVTYDDGIKPIEWNTRKSLYPSLLNLRGAVSTLDRVDGRCPLDEGLISRDGFYMIDDTAKERLINGWLAFPSPYHIQDFYVFLYGTDYKSALKNLGAISGKAPMNRKYMHGVWYCRFFNYNANDYRQLVREYRENDFPLDVLVFDMDWHTTKEAKIGSGSGGTLGWTGYTWNREQFPEPGQLIAEFAKDNIAIPLNDHPADGIRPHEEYYVPFMRAMGLNPEKDKAPLFDASNKHYMENFFKYALDPNEKLGVAFWWLDWQQDFQQPYVLGTRVRHLTWLNHLYYQHSKKENLRGALYSRWGGWGTQRYPIQFSGDTYASWESLAFQVEMTSSSGNAGCFFWAHDIGGHFNGTDPEMYVRWTQFGAMTSTLRIHSADNAPDRRPWLWGKKAANAMRKAYHFRSKLMPYIYSSLWQVCTDILPLNRAMYIDYPLSDESYNNPQQYMFGDLLLAAPIVSSGEGVDYISAQDVWFPKGDSWYDFFTGEKYEGGTRCLVKAPLDRFPVFVKGGYPLPMQPFTQRMATTQIDTLVVRCYKGEIGKTGNYSLYEDDGLTTNYEWGEYAVTKMAYSHDKSGIVTVSIAPTHGEYDDQPDKRVVRVEMPDLSPQAVAMIDGKQISIEKNTEGISYIESIRKDITQSFVFTIKNAYE